MRFPDENNHYLENHVELLLRSFEKLTGRALIESSGNMKADAKAIFEAPFFVASHNNLEDPVLTYGNQTALELFELT